MAVRCQVPRSRQTGEVAIPDIWAIAPTDPILGPAGTPSGAVQFFDSVDGAAAQPLGPQEALTIGNGGTPIFTLPTVLPTGTNVITVEYLGDTNWLATTSKPATVAVAK
jgi:hypothetical protein